MLNEIAGNWMALKSIGAGYDSAGNAMQKISEDLSKGSTQLGPIWNGRAALEAALRRLDSDLDGVRRAVERSSQVTFPDVDFTAAPDQPDAYDGELERLLADAMSEWHEDYGWATTMPDEVRSDRVARIRIDVDEQRRRG